MKENESLEIFHSAPVPKAVLTNALPAMMAMLMALIYNLADTFFIGMTEDAFQVAAISLTTPAFLLFVSIANIFGIGGTSVISRALGQGNTAYAKKVCAFCMWVGALAGLALTAAFLLFMDPILQLLGASADTWSHAKDYLSIAALSGPFVVISNCYSNVLRTEGQSARAMLGALLGNLVNVILDPIMILGLGWNTTGAAVATVIGNFVGAGYYLLFFLRGKSMLSIHIKHVTLRQKVCSGVLSIGIPASFSSMLMSISQILQNNQMSHYNDMAVAGLGVAAKVAMITSVVCLGLSQGVQPLLGYCAGAKLHQRFHDVLRYSLILVFVLGAVLAGLCFLFAPQLVRAFLSQPDAIDYGVRFVRIYMTTGFSTGLFFVLVGTMQAIGAAQQALITNLSRRGFTFIPIMFALQWLFGMDALVWAQPISDLIVLVVAAVLCSSAVKRRLH